MFESCTRTDSLLGHPAKAPLNQISDLHDIITMVPRAGVAQHYLDKVSAPKVLIPSEQLDDWSLTNLAKLLHFSLTWHTLDLSLFEDLETFGVAWEEGCPCDKLKEDAACRPNVNAAVVLVAAHYQLRGSVVPRNDVRSIQIIWIQNFGRPKVSNFHLRLQQACLRRLV